MLNLLTFIVGIIVVFLLARYNKSNKLFWLLLLSMMSGFIGGTIAANIKSDKKSSVEYVSQNMTSCSLPTAMFGLLNSDTEQEVPTVETSAVFYTTESTTLSKGPDFTPLYHGGLSPFIFDSS